MFEQVKEKEMFEKYFPSKPHSRAGESVVNPVSPHTNTMCSSHHCCTPPPCHCYISPRCQRCPSGHSNHDTQDLSGAIKELTDKVCMVVGDIAVLKSELGALTRTPPPIPTHQQETVPTYDDNPLSPEIMIVETSEEQLTPEHQDSSTQAQHNTSTSSSNTIDDHVAENPYLNCSVPTNQLPQLMQ